MAVGFTGLVLGIAGAPGADEPPSPAAGPAPTVTVTAPAVRTTATITATATTTATVIETATVTVSAEPATTTVTHDATVTETVTATVATAGEPAAIQPLVPSAPAATTPPSAPTTPPDTGGCVIKGNIANDGEKIYHVPGQRFYDATKIDTSKGERWFCTEQEARDAGWRKAKV